MVGDPIAVSPSVCHHLTSCRRHASGVTRLTVSLPAVLPVVSSGRCGPVTLARSDQRPDGPRHAVRQGDGDDFHRFLLQHAASHFAPSVQAQWRAPVVTRSSAAARGNLRRHAGGVPLARRAQIQEPPEVPVSGLGDAPEPFLAAAGMRLRREPEPCGVVPRRAEVVDLRRHAGGVPLARRGDRARRDGADSRDRGEALGQRIGLLRRLDPRGQLLDLLLRLRARFETN